VIYSCFDEKGADYLYFEDGERRALNGDLPVPELPEETNGIGVPSAVAARPLPPGARYVGRGWTARGMIVRCPVQAGVGEVPGATDNTTAYLFLAGVAALALVVALGDF
jgi:hypothetical protein